MVDSLAFKTRARTIDHLGREQIADCPTAISELWKNAYDAYAREVALHIYDGEVPIAALVDDGHGMNRREFEEKWLVVGTESKADGSAVTEEDRNGLLIRPRQGQKGIGRLSSAALGPLLLVVSKRRTEPFVAALIDWRLFENPFLYLQDIELPVVEFSEQSEIFNLLPSMFDRLMGNLWGDGDDKDRDNRIALAWKNNDNLEKNEGRPLTRGLIEKVIIGTTFTERYFEQWPLWSGKKDAGTALLIGNISFDLVAQMDSRVMTEDKSAADQAIKRLFETLSNFTDPFVDPEEAQDQEEIMEAHSPLKLAGEANNISKHLNCYVSTKPIEGFHLTTGHILEFLTQEGNREYGVCLSPACDMVPGQKTSGWFGRLGDYIPFIIVFLTEVSDKTALANIDQNIFLFLNISGDIRTFAFNPNGDVKLNPSWEQMFAENKGVLIGVNKELVIRRLCSDPQNLKIESIKAKLVAQLRYKYALNLLQRLGVSLTRIGLDFRNILYERKKP